jgi:hypothetical protein
VSSVVLAGSSSLLFWVGRGEEGGGVGERPCFLSKLGEAEVVGSGVVDGVGVFEVGVFVWVSGIWDCGAGGSAVVGMGEGVAAGGGVVIVGVVTLRDETPLGRGDVAGGDAVSVLVG